MESIKYFRVVKETINGQIYCAEVDSDGDEVETRYEADSNFREITTGFSVDVLDESGVIIDTEFYPVNTYTEDFTNNEEEVLKKIKADHPAPEWQNNTW